MSAHCLDRICCYCISKTEIPLKRCSIHRLKIQDRNLDKMTRPYRGSSCEENNFLFVSPEKKKLECQRPHKWMRRLGINWTQFKFRLRCADCDTTELDHNFYLIQQFYCLGFDVTWLFFCILTAYIYIYIIKLISWVWCLNSTKHCWCWHCWQAHPCMTPTVPPFIHCLSPRLLQSSQFIPTALW